MPNKSLQVLLELEANKFKAGLNQVNKDLNGFSGSIFSLGNMLKFTSFTGLIAGLGFSGKAALNASADYEQAKVSFEVMLGSAEKAGALLKQIADFAAETPFEMPELIDNAKKLLAFGTAAEDIIPTLNKLGDISQGNAEKLNSITDAFGKMQAKGRADMEQLNRFIDAGVPIMTALAKQTGKTKSEIFDLVSQGKVGFSDVKKALQGLTDEGGQFNGMMKKQSETMSGLQSTLSDGFTAISRTIGNRLAPTAKNVLKLMIDMVGQANELLVKYFKMRSLAEENNLNPRIDNSLKRLKGYQEALKKQSDPNVHPLFGDASKENNKKILTNLVNKEKKNLDGYLSKRKKLQEQLKELMTPSTPTGNANTDDSNQDSTKDGGSKKEPKIYDIASGKRELAQYAVDSQYKNKLAYDAIQENIQKQKIEAAVKTMLNQAGIKETEEYYQDIFDLYNNYAQKQHETLVNNETKLNEDKLQINKNYENEIFKINNEKGKNAYINKAESIKQLTLRKNEALKKVELDSQKSTQDQLLANNESFKNTISAFNQKISEDDAKRLAESVKNEADIQRNTALETIIYKNQLAQDALDNQKTALKNLKDAYQDSFMEIFDTTQSWHDKMIKTFELVGKAMLNYVWQTMQAYSTMSGLGRTNSSFWGYLGSSILGMSTGSSTVSAVSNATLPTSFSASPVSLFGNTIPGYASGTNYAQGGLSLVGEDGPELVNLKRGSQVISNDKISLGQGQNNTTYNTVKLSPIFQSLDPATSQKMFEQWYQQTLERLPGAIKDNKNGLRTTIKANS